MARAFICGISGTGIEPDEVAFLRETDPFGLILFKRNVDNPVQVKALTAKFRESVGPRCARFWSTRKAAACSGSVRRIGRPIRRVRPMPRSTVADRDRARGGASRRPADRRGPARCRHRCRLPAGADVPVAGADEVIGDRAFGTTPEQVSALAGAQARRAAGRRRAAGAEALAGTRPRHRRQPSSPAGGRYRPRHPRSDRLCGVSRRCQACRSA